MGPLVAKPLIDMWVPPDVTPAGRGNGPGAANKAVLGRLAGSEDAWELVTEAKAEEWGVRSSRLATVADKKHAFGVRAPVKGVGGTRYEFMSADEGRRMKRQHPPQVVATECVPVALTRQQGGFALLRTTFSTQVANGRQFTTNMKRNVKQHLIKQHGIRAGERNEAREEAWKKMMRGVGA